MPARRIFHGVAAAACLAAGAASGETLTILHSNDFHARVLPSDSWGNPCPPGEGDGCTGGAARLMTAVREARMRDPGALLLSAGDQFPNPAYDGPFDPALSAELMNRLGYDAMTPGNADFQTGLEGLAGFAAQLDFPLLAANGDFAGTLPVARSTVLERGGERIGIIGVLLEYSKVSRGYRTPVPTLPAAPAVQAEADRLAADGAARIIVLSHLGYRADIRLAETVSGIDVIVGGHTHSHLSSSDAAAAGPYPTMVGDVAIVQTRGFGESLGVLRVRFDAEGRVIGAEGAPLPLDAGVAEDPAVKALITGALPSP